MTTIEEQENQAFAESVRQQAIRIATLIAAGKTEEAASAALLLCTQAGNQHNLLAGVPTPKSLFDVIDDEANYCLSVFNQQYGSEGEGLGKARE